jgi:hypothetical protein
MRCTICGGESFRPTAYVTPSVHAVALECDNCSAVLLDERVARSDDERASVRLAIAARQHVIQLGARRRTDRVAARDAVHGR